MALDPSSSISSELGPLLSRLRAERDLPQKQVAQDAGINNSTLSRLESGERGVSREVLERICNALSLSRRQRLDVMVAAGFLTDESASLLADEGLSRLAELLADPATEQHDVERLRQFIDLALAFASARGYRID